MKKAQTEILGLAIVVILLTLVALVALKFFVTREPADTRKRYLQSELATSFLSTLLKTSSGCSKTTFEELLQDCAQGMRIECTDPDNPLSTVDSCVYAENRITLILDNSLAKQDKEYNFSVYPFNGITDPAKEIVSADFTCRNYKSKVWPVPLRGGTMIVRLDICE